MENAETVLVVILASFLALFLVLSIVTTVKVIQLLNRLKHISEKAELIADKAENAANLISKAAGPAMIAKVLSNFAGVVSKKTKKKR